MDKKGPLCTHNKRDVCKFIDKYVTCDKYGTEPFLVNYQTHRHAKTCMKKNKAICRFNFPIPPMPVTMILSPLEEDDDNFASAAIVYLDICAYLNSETFKDCELDFEEFLSKLNLDFETYIYAFRSSLKQDKMFLKRKPKEVIINAYNVTLLRSWFANMDIQFILDPYACATYIVL